MGSNLHEVHPVVVVVTNIDALVLVIAILAVVIDDAGLAVDGAVIDILVVETENGSFIDQGCS